MTARPLAPVLTLPLATLPAAQAAWGAFREGWDRRGAARPTDEAWVAFGEVFPPLAAILAAYGETV